MPWQVGGYATEGEKPFDQGSFGTVWKAHRLSDDAPVALKLVLLTDAADARERIAAASASSSTRPTASRRQSRASPTTVSCTPT
jgi:hypothetical protein